MSIRMPIWESIRLCDFLRFRELEGNYFILSERYELEIHKAQTFLRHFPPFASLDFLKDIILFGSLASISDGDALWLKTTKQFIFKDSGIVILIDFFIFSTFFPPFCLHFHCRIIRIFSQFYYLWFQGGCSHWIGSERIWNFPSDRATYSLLVMECWFSLPLSRNHWRNRNLVLN